MAPVHGPRARRAVAHGPNRGCVAPWVPGDHHRRVALWRRGRGLDRVRVESPVGDDMGMREFHHTHAVLTLLELNHAGSGAWPPATAVRHLKRTTPAPLRARPRTSPTFGLVRRTERPSGTSASAGPLGRPPTHPGVAPVQRHRATRDRDLPVHWRAERRRLRPCRDRRPACEAPRVAPSAAGLARPA